MSASTIYDLAPEPKFERANESAAGAISRVRALLAADVTPMMGPDELEILALQLKMAACHLVTSAAALRECEEERRRLAAWREREERRFEPEPGETGT